MASPLVATESPRNALRRHIRLLKDIRDGSHAFRTSFVRTKGDMDRRAAEERIHFEKEAELARALGQTVVDFRGARSMH